MRLQCLGFAMVCCSQFSGFRVIIFGCLFITIPSALGALVCNCQSFRIEGLVFF